MPNTSPVALLRFVHAGGNVSTDIGRRPPRLMWIAPAPEQGSEATDCL